MVLTPCGREFESVYTNHRFTTRERETLASHESFDYLPSHSATYKEWLQRHPARLDWDRWLMMGMIGFTVGLVAFLLHQLIHSFAELKWHLAEILLQENSLAVTWLWVASYSVCVAAVSAALVAFVCPAAGGSGIPEVMGFLNGTVMRHVLSMKAFFVKFFSCSFAVGSGLPAGQEAPMIHIGSIVGNGLSQFQSKTLGFTTPYFARFRNPEDRRNFTTAGAAAGVAAAFGAPVGGLLFAMEEVSSFWTIKLGWMICFCCVLATFTADILNASFDSFHLTSMFGIFKTDKYLIFKLHNAIPVNVVMFIPAVLLGLVGGLLGALFTVMNLKIARLRGRVFKSIKSPRLQRIARFLEPPIIMAVWATVTVFIPSAFPCRPLICPRPGISNFTQHVSSSHSERMHFDTFTEGIAHKMNLEAQPHHESGRLGDAECPTNPVSYTMDDHLQSYWCQELHKVNGTTVDGEYNEVASLLNVHGQTALRLLYSRRTPYQFGYLSLLTALPLYFLGACWVAGSAVASGLVVPMLYIGALYGRMMGRLLVDIYGGVPTALAWQWIDPGALALIGSASFFAGVSRLTMSLAVIMIEITNDVAFLLPIIVAIMVAKWVGDYMSHPLYHSQLELKCIPYLDSEEPLLYDDESTLQNFELFKARHVMQSPVLTITPRESLAHLAHLLLETSHGGFPVVRRCEDTACEVAYGLLTRHELCVILCHENTRMEKIAGRTITVVIPYEELSDETLESQSSLKDVLQNYVSRPLYADIYIDLEPYINRSSLRIEEDFSLHRTYIMFRTLGLRHLTVVDMANRAVGIITRKDLMGFSLDEKLEQRKARGVSFAGGYLKLLPSEEQKA